MVVGWLMLVSKYFLNPIDIHHDYLWMLVYGG